MKNEANQWIEFARKDLLAAKKLSTEHYIGNIVLFHCQQAIEKIIKGALAYHAVSVPKIHSSFKYNYATFDKNMVDAYSRPLLPCNSLGDIDKARTGKILLFVRRVC